MCERERERVCVLQAFSLLCFVVRCVSACTNVRGIVYMSKVTTISIIRPAAGSLIVGIRPATKRPKGGSALLCLASASAARLVN